MATFRPLHPQYFCPVESFAFRYPDAILVVRDDFLLQCPATTMIMNVPALAFGRPVAPGFCSSNSAVGRYALCLLGSMSIVLAPTAVDKVCQISNFPDALSPATTSFPSRVLANAFLPSNFVASTPAPMGRSA